MTEGSGTGPSSTKGSEPMSAETVASTPTGVDDAATAAEATPDVERARLDDLLDLSADYVNKAIASMLDRLTVHQGEIHAALAAADLETVRSTAHRFAGGALNLGLERVAATARVVEHLAATGDAAGVRAHLDELAAVCALAGDALVAYRDEMTLR